MDVRRSIRALRVPVALELVVARHPRRTLLASLYSSRQVRPGSARLVSCGGCPPSRMDPDRAGTSSLSARRFVTDVAGGSSGGRASSSGRSIGPICGRVADWRGRPGGSRPSGYKPK